MQWINVKEKLPENDEYECIILTDGAKICCGFYDESYGGFFGCCRDIHIHKVTHWMPLTQPPKELTWSG